MSVTVMFTALIAGVIIWLFVVTRLTARSWERPGETGDEDGAAAIAPARLGLWAFMAVATSLFSLFISAYVMRMHHGFWCHIDLPRVLWLNTGMLVVASLALQRASRAVDSGRMDRVRSGLSIGGVLSIAFLVGQWIAWRQLSPTMYFIQGNPANAFFHLLTAVHGLHVLGGLWVWGRTVTRLAAGAELIDIRQSVKLCTTYWHYLLLVWLALFAVLNLS
jgi:cytochrome c oxidase subunit 3